MQRLLIKIWCIIILMMCANIELTAQPIFMSSPHSSGETTSTFDLTVEPDVNSFIYVVVLADGASEPSAQAVIDEANGFGSLGSIASEQFFATGGFTTLTTITGLDASTSYDVYVAAEDEASFTAQAFATLVEVTTASAPPVFLNGTPSTNNLTESSFDLTVNVDIGSRIGYVVLPDGANPPTSTQVKNHLDSEFNPVTLSGTFFALTPGADETELVDGLAASTSYDVYVVAMKSDNTNQIQAAPTKLDITTVSTIPTFQNGTPSTNNLTESSFDLTVNVDIGSRIGYVVLPDGANPPTSTQVKNHLDSEFNPVTLSGTFFALTPGADETELVDGLAASTSYDVYVVAMKSDNTSQIQAAPTKLDVTTASPPDITPPSFTNGPTASNETDESFDLTLQLDEAGTVYYVILPEAATPPSAVQVSNNQDASGNPVALSGSFAAIGAQDHTEAISGLSATTDYDVYVVAEDGSGNLQANSVKVEVTTEAAPAEFQNGTPSISNVSGSGFDVTVNTDLSGFVYYIVLDRGAPEPSPAQVSGATDGNGDAGIVSGNFEITNAFEDVVHNISGLQHSTEYDFYLFPFNNVGGLPLSATKIEIESVTPAPATFQNGTPSISNLAGDNFDVTVNADLPCFAYYVVLDRGAPAPTPIQVAGGVTSVTSGAVQVANAFEDVLHNINGLQPSTDYDLYLMTFYNQGGNVLSESTTKVEFTTTTPPDVTPPSFTNGPTASNETDMSFDLEVELDESGFVHYVVLPDESSIPTATEVYEKAFNDTGLESAVVAGSVSNAATLTSSTIIGLSASTAYDVYTVAEDLFVNLQASATLVEVTTIASVPAFQELTPSVSNVEENSFDLTVNMDMESFVFYIVLPDGSDAPSSTQVINSEDADGNFVMNGGGVVIENASTNVVIEVSGLLANTSYDIYVVADDNQGNIQPSPILVDVTTAIDETAPVFQNGTPFVDNTTSTSIDVTVQLNEEGAAFWIALPQGATEPSAFQVANSQDANGDFVDENGFLPITSGSQDFTGTLNGLTEATDYDLYVVAVDPANNMQANPTKVAVSTTSGATTPSFQNGTPSVDVYSTSLDLTLNLDISGSVFYVVLPDGATPPSSYDVVGGNDADGNPVTLYNEIAVSSASSDVIATIVGLTASTSYDVYVVAYDGVDILGTLQANPTKVEVTTTGEPPVFQGVTPYLFPNGPTSFTATVNLDKTGFVAYVALADEAAPPSSLQVLNSEDGNGDFVMLSGSTAINDINTNVDFDINGLTASTDYDIYFIAYDMTGAISSTPVLVEALTPVPAPVFQNGTPSTSNVTANSFDLTLNLDISGSVFYVVLPDGATPLSSYDVVGGNDADGNPVTLYNEIAVSSASSDVTATIVGLTASTSYDVYVVAYDGVDLIGTLQANPTLIEITTLADVTAPVFVDGPNAINITYSGFDIEVELDEQGVIYAVVMPDGATAPTSDEIIDKAVSNTGLPNAILVEQFLDNGGALNSYTIEGVESITSYDVYVVAEDLSLNHQAVPTLVEVTTELAVPVFQNGTPSVDVDIASLDLTVNLDMAGEVYYVVLPDNATPPTSLDVLGGFNADGNLAFRAGFIEVNAPSTDETETISGLSPSTSYDMYVVAWDGSAMGSLQADPTLVEVTVETNEPPVLSAIGDLITNEGFELTFTATATDADIPSHVLTYWLDATSEGLGMVIDGSTGAFSWTPSEDQDGDHTVTVTVSDGFDDDSETITITVNEINEAPVLSAIGDQSVSEGSELTFTASAVDADIPVQALTYSLDPTSEGLGMVIDGSTGAFSWTPSEDQGGDHTVTVTVSDGFDDDSETITITVNEINEAPVLSVIGDQSVSEGSELTFTASAVDADIPVQALTYSLDATSEGLGLTIDGSTGTFSWIPGEAQNGDHTVTVTVSDGEAEDSETITVTVNEVNQAPVLSAIADQVVDEGAELTLTAMATDADLPVQTLNYSLDATSVELGMIIDVLTGEFSWTPGVLNAGNSYIVSVIADDGVVFDSKDFTITVNESAVPNEFPVIAQVDDVTVEVLNNVNFVVTATDADVPAQTLTYSLDVASVTKGMTIDENDGTFDWTPSILEVGDHTVEVIVSDGLDFLSHQFVITVNEAITANNAPVMDAVGTQTVVAGSNLTFTVSATDVDVDMLSYSLDNQSSMLGMSINSTTGVFNWTPSVLQIGMHTVRLFVDDGTDFDFEDITITVSGIANTAPVLSAVGDQSTDEGMELTFTASASDIDVPSQTLAYSLDAASEDIGMMIDGSTGVFSWTPGEDEDGTYSVTVFVSDGENEDNETIAITVNEVNEAPVLASIGAKSVDEGTALTFTARATDVDVPLQTLTYSLDATSLGLGMTIDGSTGEFNWTPGEDQDGDHTVIVTVSDGTAEDSETITITVNEVNEAPVLASIGARSVDEGTALTFTAVATDADVPVQTLTYSLDVTSTSKGMTIDGSEGVFNWTPAEDQNGDHTITVTVSDGTAVDSETITVTVNEVNEAPVLNTVGNQSVDKGSELIFTVMATDSDVPVQELTYSLDATSTGLGMTINASTGAFSWTPNDTQVDTYSVTLTVSDGNASDTETFDVVVNQVLGLNDLAVNVVIYPNPVQASFELDGVGTSHVEVEVFNVDGTKFVPTKKNNRYDISHLASGTYYIHIIDRNGEILTKRRIIKNK